MNTVAELLERAGLSAREAAELCGVTRQTVGNWRAGRTPITARARDLLEAAANTEDARRRERERLDEIERLEKRLRLLKGQD